jgi:hypothetical protein
MIPKYEYMEMLPIIINAIPFSISVVLLIQYME